MPGKFIKKMSKKSVVAPDPSTISDAVTDSLKQSADTVESSSLETPLQEENKMKPESSERSANDGVVSSGPVQLKPLAPLDLAKKAPKKKRGKASRSNLKKKRENKHAVSIQSKWRGHCARKTITERKAEKEAEKLREPDKDNAEEEKLEDFSKIPFEDIKRVQFCVDSAVGLPVNCTATRVSCRLLQQDRSPVSESGESFSDPETPVTSPGYDLFMTWKASSLHPSYTLLCRVDTLDRVSLEPKTVGYAALKLCSLADGTQPLPDGASASPESENTSSFLNAGRFRLPLLLGKLPDWCPLTEERLEDLPVVPDAFLTVRLFDASVEEPPRHDCPTYFLENGDLRQGSKVKAKYGGRGQFFPGQITHDHGDGTYDIKFDSGEQETKVGVQFIEGGAVDIENCDGNVATLLYATYDNLKVANRMRKEGKHDLPLWTDLGEDLKLGRPLEKEEWRELRPLLVKWLTHVFPDVNQMRHTVNPNYSFRFKDTDNVGVLAGVDMLYNMPVVRPRDLPPNSVVGYKTVLHYLRGSKIPWPTDAEPEDDPRFILDDVSQCWDFESSTTRCPVFTDDFKLISNMQLGPNACVLLMVTRVDITFTTSASYDLKMPFRQPHRSWWGLVPLRVASPFYSPEGSRLESSDFDGAFVNAGMHQVPLFEGIPPVSVMESDNPLETVKESLRKAEADTSSGSCPCWCMGNSEVLPSDIHPDEFDEPMFSRSGASAIVRVQDSRLVRFATEHIKMNNSIIPSTYLLDQLLASQSKASYRKSLFAYDAFKYDLDKFTSELILPAILKEPKLLLDGINFKSEADCLEYIDNIPSA